ncbi:hypothetical protein HYY73_05895 [Candidatus Woesearchaeota archaeon]|nr:hypothetical protein [Candidatus Woesearchaeota archaeon]
MVGIGLVCAVEWEVPSALPFSKEQGEIVEVPVGGHSVYVTVSGIGQTNAANALSTLFEAYKPDYILSLGICGAAQDNLGVGCLLVANRVHYGDHDIPVQSSLLEKVVGCLSVQSIPHHVGAFQTFDHLVASREEVLSGIVGVDLESYGLAAAAKAHGVPVVIVKAATDILPVKESFESPHYVVGSIERNFPHAKRQLDTFFDQYTALP